MATHLTIFEKLVPSFKPALSFLWSAGVGADARRPPCRKAKELRKERRLQKEQLRRDADGVTSAVTSNPSTPIHTNQPKHLEDFISESLPNSPSHCLEVSRWWSRSFLFSFYVSIILIPAIIKKEGFLLSFLSSWCLDPFSFKLWFHRALCPSFSDFTMCLCVLRASQSRVEKPPLPSTNSTKWQANHINWVSLPYCGHLNHSSWLSWHETTRKWTCGKEGCRKIPGLKLRLVYQCHSWSQPRFGPDAVMDQAISLSCSYNLWY